MKGQIFSVVKWWSSGLGLPDVLRSGRRPVMSAGLGLEEAKNIYCLTAWHSPRLNIPILINHHPLQSRHNLGHQGPRCKTTTPLPQPPPPPQPPHHDEQTTIHPPTSLRRHLLRQVEVHNNLHLPLPRRLSNPPPRTPNTIRRSHRHRGRQRQSQCDRRAYEHRYYGCFALFTAFHAHAKGEIDECGYCD